MKVKSIFILLVVALMATACAPKSAPAESYTVNLTPADFVSAIDNPYLPLLPGSK